MVKRNAILSTESENYPDLQPKDIFRIMAEGIGEDGTLCLDELPFDTDMTRCALHCRMDRDRFDPETLKKEFSELFDNLVMISMLTDCLPEDPCDYGKVMDRENLKVWDAYLRDFDIGDLDADAVLTKDFEEGEQLSEEEAAILDEYEARCRQDAEKRVGCGPQAYELVLRAKRVERLLELKAPLIIIRCERNMLAECFAIHRFAQSAERRPAEE